MSLSGTEQKNKVKDGSIVKLPRLYKVLLHNDHYTTMEFVVYILMTIFNKSHDDAVRIMLKVHREGVGIAGIYIRSVAEAKAESVHRIAKENGYPLKCSITPE